MLRQMARQGRMEAILNEEQFTDQHTQKLAEILQSEAHSDLKNSFKELSSLQTAIILTEAKELLPTEYNMILQYLRSGQPWHSYTDVPHPPGSLVLPPCALQPPNFKLQGRVFSHKTSHVGNSGILFKSPVDSTRLTGSIEKIWQIPLQNYMQTFILVQVHKPLSPEMLSNTPFVSMPLFATTVVDAAPSERLYLIEPRHIITHLTVYKRPPGTYKINCEILVISWSLNRGRRS